MNNDAILFFARMPKALPLYEAFHAAVCAEFEDFAVKVQKTQITYSNKHNFAFVSLPFRKLKGAPDVYILLSFGLNRKLDDPRVYQAVEPYPTRWTHHVIIQSADEIDGQILDWLREAYTFSLIK